MCCYQKNTICLILNNNMYIRYIMIVVCSAIYQIYFVVQIFLWFQNF